MEKFQLFLMSINNDIKRVSLELLEHVELVLSLKPGALRITFCENPGCFLHCYFYPKNRETPAGDYRIEPHTDKGFITLLWQDKIGGLRAKVNDSWVDLPYRKDHFVVNLGDMLEYITSGVVKGKEPEIVFFSRFSLFFVFIQGILLENFQ